MNIDDLTIGEAKALAGMFQNPNPAASTELKHFHGLCLVVADRGHVWVGQATTDNQWCRIKSARIVRQWGTSKGLNELAKNGPLSGTKLDDNTDVLVNMRAVIALIPCEASKWNF